MTLTHRPFHLKTHAKPAFFVVFAKSFGAGVGLGMNSTSMELEGTGVQQPLGTRVTVSGTAPANVVMQGRTHLAGCCCCCCWSGFAPVSLTVSSIKDGEMSKPPT